MPHVHMLIQKHILGPAEAMVWAKANGYGDIRLPFEDTVKKPGAVAVFPTIVDSLEPREHKLGVEFVFETGMYYTCENLVLWNTLALYERLADSKAVWKLPERWGLWFCHKHPSDNLFVSQENLAELKARSDDAGGKTSFE